MLKLEGSFVALVTPMTEKGEVDYQDLDILIDYHLNNKTNGIVLLGTTGEAATLSYDEKEKIVKRGVSKIKGKIPLLVGTGHNSTAETINQTKQAQEWGADAALVVTPYYNKPSQSGLLAHYKAVAQSVNSPIVLYNVPGRTACDMQAETTAILAREYDNIIAIKEAVDMPKRIEDLAKLCPGGFNLLSGDDASFIRFMQAGGHGTISVTANIVPREISDICAAAKQGNWQLALKTNSKLQDLHTSLFISSNPMPVKWALFYLGIIKSAQCRLPLLPLEQQFHKQVISALDFAGIKNIRL